jgi:septum site-determining protein MinD
MVKLATQHSSGMHYLCAPPSIQLSKGVTPDSLGKLYKAMPNVYPLTVIDCGSAVDPWAIKAMEFSTLIFLVTNPDILVMHQTKRIMTEMIEQLFPIDMIEVVLNRFVQNAAVAPATIQRTLGKPVYAAIPDDTVSHAGALTAGKPLVLNSPSAPSSRAIHEMVRKMQQNQLLQKLAVLKKPSRAQLAASQKQVGGIAAQSGAGSKALATKEPDAPRMPGQVVVAHDPWSALKLRVHKELVEKIDFKKENNNQAGLKALREKCRTAVVDILNQEDTASVAPTRDDLQQLVKEILDEALGFGPLEDLLADDAVTEIMVNTANQIYTS